MLKSWVATACFCGLVALPLHAFAFGGSPFPHLEDMPTWKPSGTTLGEKKTGEVQQRLNKMIYYSSFAKSEIDAAEAADQNVASQCEHLRAAKSYSAQMASLGREIKAIVGADPFGQQTNTLNAVDGIIEDDAKIGEVIASQCSATSSGSATSSSPPEPSPPSIADVQPPPADSDIPQLADSVIFINYVCQTVVEPGRYEKTKSDVMNTLLRINPDQAAAAKAVDAAESEAKDLCADPGTCWTQAVSPGEPVTKAQARKDCVEAINMGMDVISREVASGSSNQ